MKYIIIKILIFTPLVLPALIYANVSQKQVPALSDSVVQSLPSNDPPLAIDQSADNKENTKNGATEILETPNTNELGGSEHQNNDIRKYLGVDY